MGVIRDMGINILNYIKPKCRDGSSILFWEDNWRSDAAFKDLIPRLYMLENVKDSSVADKLAHEDLERSFRRKPRGGRELQQLESIKEQISGCILSNSKDRWTWSLKGSGEFTVSSLRKAIDSIFLPNDGSKTRWIKEVPIKVNIIAWKISHDYLPTRMNLSKRGMDIENITCSLCNCMAETSSHIFFSSIFSQQIMRKIFSWWELEFQEINTYDEWLVWISNFRLRSDRKKMFEDDFNQATQQGLCNKDMITGKWARVNGDC
ncbi:RNA-directed DNA polymerase, eukaryota, reverse transcriptase zinc-binding domain protein [Tanacetum coccineum]